MKRTWTLPLLFSFSTACLGCAGANPEPIQSDAQRLDAVREAMTSPTGTVTPATVRALSGPWQAFLSVHAAFESILAVRSPAAASCLSGSLRAGEYDLGCLTGGRVIGHLTFQSAAVGGSVDAALSDACVGDACVDAAIRIEIADPSHCAALATLAVTATVSRAGNADALSFGVQGGMGRGEFMPRVVIFDASGQSLLVDGDVGSAGPYLISGADQSFECTFVGAGGRCDGETAFTF